MLHSTVRSVLGWGLVLLVLSLWAPGVEPTPCRAKRSGTKPFGLEEVIMGNFSANGFNGVWISGSEFLFSNKTTGEVIKHDVTTSTQTLLIEKSVLDEYRASSFELSADQLFLMIRYDQKPGFRHSSSAKCVIYDLVTKEFSPLADQKLLALVAWAPVGHGLVFVLENDLYYRTANGFLKRITFSGVPEVIYNGIPDWVYEEEVLGSGSAVWFSPDGERLAFASFNDTLVKVATYWHYGQPGSMASQYPEAINLRYPKPGTSNPNVHLNVVELLSPSLSVTELPAPTDAVTTDYVLAEVTWAGQRVSAVWANRVQNVNQITEYNVANAALQKAFDVLEERGWIDVQRPMYDATGSRFLTLLSTPQAGGGNFRHLVVVSEGVATPLTAGRFVVTQIYGWDEPNGVVYYQATAEGMPAKRHVYATSQNALETPVCLSCDVKTLEGRECAYASASFSTDMSHYALVCSGPDPAHVAVYRANTGALLSLWEDNAELRDKIKERELPEILDTEVDVPGGFKAQARLWLPPDMDQTGATKYPMLVYVYAGPNSVQISDAFSITWGTYMATNRSVIYCMIDGRGSGLKGDDMMFAIYRGMGSVEIEDQISVTKVLQQRYQYIDTNRTAIWGWSYGGYATAMALAQDTDNVFKCGASVAPVTSWIYYDTIYTERYMGLPTEDDNLGGYNASDVTRRVDNFRNKHYYLLHGNADDNVHYLQAMMLSRALEKEDILFRQQSYPDENHGLSGTILHVYHSMDQFWRDCFDQNGEEPSHL